MIEARESLSWISFLMAIDVSLASRLTSYPNVEVRMGCSGGLDAYVAPCPSSRDELLALLPLDRRVDQPLFVGVAGVILS